MDPDPLPPPLRLLGLAGLLPFAALALAALLRPDDRDLILAALLAYGALIAAFLGAVHWGLALRPRPGEESLAWPRAVLGVLPALLAWLAMFLPGGWSLGAVAVLILAVAAAETRAARRGLLPAPYLRLRWTLSLGAAACLLVGAAVG